MSIDDIMGISVSYGELQKESNVGVIVASDAVGYELEGGEENVGSLIIALPPFSPHHLPYAGGWVRVEGRRHDAFPLSWAGVDIPGLVMQRRCLGA